MRHSRQESHHHDQRSAIGQKNQRREILIEFILELKSFTCVGRGHFKLLDFRNLLVNHMNFRKFLGNSCEV